MKYTGVLRHLTQLLNGAFLCQVHVKQGDFTATTLPRAKSVYFLSNASGASTNNNYMSGAFLNKPLYQLLSQSTGPTN